ncbi:hypothetical protein E4U30_006852 [Claviceps sp. LM220 group G6]|nr:hypothetical protein E4U15_005861 [Claviceps sp. LM218 group G6]KAG6091476.1 hypothetical protein E4U30_006852 [Claviceps sp. LM220 group G6]KAG6115337.1 hypothetical protein E4U14_000919 [Claviceps sp. LM454 group G7]
MHTLSLLAVLLPLVSPLVAANVHAQCDCQTWTEGGQWGYNRDLTRWLCYHLYTNIATWSEQYGRCIATSLMIDGQTWEDKCIEFGTQQGYYHFDDKGVPITNVPAIKVGAAVGHCPDRY